MEYLDRAISILIRLIFKTADRAEIDKTIKEVIDLLEKSKKELKRKSKKGGKNNGPETFTEA